MFGFNNKRTASNEETTNQPVTATQPDADVLSEELLNYACGYTPENYTAPAGLFRKPVPEDLI